MSPFYSIYTLIEEKQEGSHNRGYKASTKKPEYEYRYTYGQDGRVTQVALVHMENADESKYGPEEYVIQFKYDKAGRLTRKVVRNDSVQDATRYETSFEYDGRGQLTRERVMAWNATDERMEVRQDIRTTYDLGENPTVVDFYDNEGLAFRDTRTYARGYQLTGSTISDTGAGVNVSTAGFYTYDTNNNLTGTKLVDIDRDGTQLVYRAEWTFTYDRKNRLKSHTNTNASNVRGNIWYDGQGRVWQRWNDDSGTSEWDATLIRFVYDGSQLVQEHEFGVAEVESEWEYTYDDLTRDYLRHAAGLRQRQRSGGSDTDYFMQLDQGALEYKAERDPVAATITRDERSSSLNQISGGTFNDISNLATSNNYVEMYGDSTTGFDPLVQRGVRHYLAGIERFLTRKGNNPNMCSPMQVVALAEGIPGPHIPEGGEPDAGNCCVCWSTRPGRDYLSGCWKNIQEVPDDEKMICWASAESYSP